MGDYYRVELTIGDYSWSINSTDLPDYGPTDGITFGWAHADGAPLADRRPDEWATIGLVVADVADVGTLDRGDPVILFLYTNETLFSGVAPVSAALFRGVVADLAAEPHTLGMVFRVTCKGWLDHLNETLAGVYARPSETLHNRIAGLFTDAGLLAPSDPNAPTMMLRAFESSPTPIMDLADRFLSQAIDPAPYVTGHADRYILQPRFTVGNVLDTAAPLLMTPVTPTATASLTRPLPLVFGDTGTGLYGPILDADYVPSAGVMPLALDACWLSMDATWMLGPGEVDTATVAGLLDGVQQAVTVSNPNPIPELVAVTDTDLTTVTAARELARFLLPPAGESVRWSVDEFVLIASLDTIPAELGWRLGQSVTPGHGSRVPALVFNIPAHQNPDGGRWYPCSVTGAKWTVQGGRAWLSLTLSRVVPTPTVGTGSGAAYLAWDRGAEPIGDLNDNFPTVTWDDIDPEFTWVDYRLIRNP